MTPAKDRTRKARVDSHAAVSNARSMRKDCADGTYDEMIKRSPFRIRPARELLDSAGEIDLEKAEDEEGQE
jgi:hypothetical protein